MIPGEMPIIEIDDTNIDNLWPCLIFAIRSSTFVALDTELSGLGNRSLLGASDLEERYKAISDAAQTRSIVALGVSCFKCKNDQTSASEEKIFSVQTFNILTLCSEEYVVDTSSVQFLAEHGFDFNKQSMHGIKFTRGNKDEGVAKENSNKNNGKPYLKMLMDELVTIDATIVLHNSLMDLVFLYSNLYCQLPTSIAKFVSDLNIMFRGGIFDTKVISEFKNKMRASFLEYVFKKCIIENERQFKQKKPFSNIEFLKYPDSVMKHVTCLNPCVKTDNLPDDAKLQVICEKFASHGCCRYGSKCWDSHNVDLIIQNESLSLTKTQKQKLRKRKIKQESITSDKKASNTTTDLICEEMATNDSEEISQSRKNPLSVGRTHTAGYDAFMTGFVFSCFLAKYSKETRTANCSSTMTDDTDDPDTSEMLQRWISWGSFPKEFINKIYLSGKKFPLHITESAFAKPSKLCSKKLNALRKT